MGKQRISYRVEGSSALKADYAQLSKYQSTPIIKFDSLSTASPKLSHDVHDDKDSVRYEKYVSVVKRTNKKFAQRIVDDPLLGSIKYASAKHATTYTDKAFFFKAGLFTAVFALLVILIGA